MAGRSFTVAIIAVLIVGVLVTPTGLARCPNTPNDCHAFGELVGSNLGSSELGLGVYKDDPPSDDGSGGKMSAFGTRSSATQDEYDSGDLGGVLVIVRTLGNASSFNIEFPANPSGIQWTNGNTLVIDPAIEGDHYLLPFTISSVAPNLDLSFNANDNLGNQTTGALNPFPALGSEGAGEEPDQTIGVWPPWATYAVVAAGVVLLFLFIRRLLR